MGSRNDDDVVGAAASTVVSAAITTGVSVLVNQYLAPAAPIVWAACILMSAASCLVGFEVGMRRASSDAVADKSALHERAESERARADEAAMHAAELQQHAEELDAELAAIRDASPSIDSMRGWSKKKARAVLKAFRADGAVSPKGFEKEIEISVRNGEGIFLAQAYRYGAAEIVGEYTIEDDWRAFLRSPETEHELELLAR